MGRVGQQVVAVSVQSVAPVAEVDYPRVRDEIAEQGRPRGAGGVQPGVVHLAAGRAKAVTRSAGVLARPYPRGPPRRWTNGTRWQAVASRNSSGPKPCTPLL